MKKTIALIALAGFLLTGCAGGGGTVEGEPRKEYTVTGKGGSLYERHVTLNNGKTITCLLYQGESITCDWKEDSE